MLLSHEELICELPKLEQLSAAERKALNDKRRAEQIELWKEKGYRAEDSDRHDLVHPKKRKKQNSPHFDPGLILLNCAATGDIEGVKKLLNQGVSPTVYNVDRITPLHQSCLENNIEITELLINAGCEIDSLDNELWTPLHAATSLSSFECVELLLRYGASHLRPNVDGQLPVDLCEDSELLEFMEMDMAKKGITLNDLEISRTSQETKFFNDVKHFIENGGNPNFQIIDNDATLLHVAAANGYVEVALYLLSKNIKVDTQDIDGWTPLHAAAFWEEVDLIELLAAHAADFKIKTLCGELPIDLVEDAGVRLLVQRLSERSELVKRHPVLRPSSVRGRLVSRMTTDKKEDIRRESVELHSVVVEQLEEDFSKAPDSWRKRAGKCPRPALRDINFAEVDDVFSRGHANSNTNSNSIDHASKGLCHQSNSVTDSHLEIGAINETLNILSSIHENGKGDRQTSIEGETVRYFSPSPTSPESRDSGVVTATSTKSCDLHEDTSATFDNISHSNTPLQSIDNLSDDDSHQGDIAKWFPTLSDDRNALRKVRKEKSFDDLSSSFTDEAPQFEDRNLSNSVQRSISLIQSQREKAEHVKRYHSLTTKMQDQPRFSPKPRGNNSKTAYKNRKKAGSSTSKHSSTADEDKTPSFHSSSDVFATNLVTIPKEESAVAAETSIIKASEEPVEVPSQSEHSSPNNKKCDIEPESGGVESMATNAGSLDGPKQADTEPTHYDKPKKKSKKCCVIL